MDHMAGSYLRAHPTAARRAALGLVLLAAFVLRVWNLDWDAGTHQHPDERFWSIVTADISAAGPIEYFDSGSSPLNPYNHQGRDTWVYGTLPLFATKAGASFLADGPFPAGALVTIADTVGIDLRNGGVDAFDAGYDANLVGRLFSALVDTGTVLLAYLLGRDLFDRRVGFVAAGLLAVTPLHIQYAHFYGAEPWVTFFATAAIWLSLRMARGDLRLRLAAGIGAVIGLAMASKLIGAAALVAPGAAVLLAVAPAIGAVARRSWVWLRRQAEAEPAAVAGAVLGVVVVCLASLLYAPIVLVMIALTAAGGVTAYALVVVRPAEQAADQIAVIFDQDADPPRVEVPKSRVPPPLHVVVWGAFTGLVVLAATALTFRVFQPYAFDGLFSLDERFTRDLDYLREVNAGGNVPWVVQWIGRTPLLFPLGSAFWWGMGPALGIAVVLGVVRAGIDVVARHRWILLLPLVYLALMLGLVSQQFNPLIRYLLPAYPVAIVLAGFGVVWLWDAGRSMAGARRPGVRFAGRPVQVLATLLVVVTALSGLAFVNGVYGNQHPRVEASVWMAENLPDGAVLSAQVWDDTLPLTVAGTEGFEYRHVSLDLFEPDASPGKIDRLIAGLDQVDYVVEASNRLYDSIPRVPARYPATTAYYDALFDGRLGFEQVAQFRNAPSLFGVTIADHDAEETFTVYDHPTVTIWAKTDTWSVARAEAILNPARAAVAADVVPADAATNALQLRPAQAALAVTGDTFDETFRGTGLIASVPWLWWLLWLQLAAVAVLPWTTLLFSRLPDAGYGLSKIIGLLAVGLGVWLTISWGLADYGRDLVWWWFAGLGGLGLALWGRHAERMSELWSRHRSSWLASELVFLAVFGLALWMRSANPDLWEAYLGGEKPMELAYLTAIARSPELPAIDPWFAGGFMNYYYFGWFLITVPMRALRVLPEVAFNLGVATYAALTATVAFGVVHNLVALSRRRWARVHDSDASNVSVHAGLAGVLLLVGIGNLDAIRLHYDRLEQVNEWEAGTGTPVIGHIVTFLGGSWAWATGTPLPRFDWWAPSRVNSGNVDITEFPYFTFLFGDLHPHLMGMAFVGLAVALALAYLAASQAGDRGRSLVLAGSLGLITAVVRTVNTWDLPSVTIVAATALIIGRLVAPATVSRDDDRRRRGLAILGGSVALAAGFSTFGGPGGAVLTGLLLVGGVAMLAGWTPPAVRQGLLSILGHALVAVGVHVLVLWPFLRSNETFDTGLQGAVDGSPLGDFVVHWGIFLVLAAGLAGALAVDLRRRARMGEPTPAPLPASVWSSPAWQATWLALATGAVLLTGRLGTGAATISVLGVIVFGYFLLVEVRRESLDLGRIVASGLFVLGFGIAGGVDVITVENDIERMNTVFKFWLQAWQYFALAGGFALWQVGRVLADRPVVVSRTGYPDRVELHPARPWRLNLWALTVGALLLAGLAYPLLATRTRLETRFAQIPVTLDGLAYLDSDPTIVRPDPNDPGREVTVAIAEDLPLIEWLRANVAGTPTLVEWAGSGYDWNARMAVHTGMPTVLGWDWHQKQQRWTFQPMIDSRLQAVRDLYTAGDQGAITDFLRGYDVAYVIVGTQERRFATPDALTALATHPALEPVFRSGANVIYAVDRAALWPI